MQSVIRLDYGDVLFDNKDKKCLVTKTNPTNVEVMYLDGTTNVIDRYINDDSITISNDDKDRKDFEDYFNHDLKRFEVIYVETDGEYTDYGVTKKTIYAKNIDEAKEKAKYFTSNYYIFESESNNISNFKYSINVCKSDGTVVSSSKMLMKRFSENEADKIVENMFSYGILNYYLAPTYSSDFLNDEEIIFSQE